MSLPALIDKRELRGKTKLRSDAHRKWIRLHRCCVSGCPNMNIDCAHVSSAATRGVGMKSSDAYTVSLCHDHHMESHTGIQTFEKKYRLDLKTLAREFYQRSPYRHRLDNPYV